MLDKVTSTSIESETLTPSLSVVVIVIVALPTKVSLGVKITWLLITSTLPWDSSTLAVVETIVPSISSAMKEIVFVPSWLSIIVEFILTVGEILLVIFIAKVSTSSFEISNISCMFFNESKINSSFSFFETFISSPLIDNSIPSLDKNVSSGSVKKIFSSGFIKILLSTISIICFLIASWIEILIPFNLKYIFDSISYP